MRNLTLFENKVLEAVFNEHSDEFNLKRELLVKLHVKEIERTKVGAYIIFQEQSPSLFKNGKNAQLGLNKSRIIIPAVPSGLGCVVLIADNQIRYIELFTYGEDQWDGETDIRNFSINEE